MRDGEFSKEIGHLRALVEEQRQELETLRQSEVSYRNQFTCNSSAMLLIDRTDGSILEANDAAVAFYGYSRRHLRSLLLSDLDASAPVEGTAPREWLPCGPGKVCEAAHRLADGTHRNVELSSSVVQWNGRAAVHLILHDVTERNRLAEAVRRSERLLSEAQRTSHLGNWSLDLLTNELLWSEEIFRIFEIDPSAFGASYEAFSEAVHPDDRDPVAQAYTASIRDRSPYEIVHRLLLPDGRVKHVHERGKTVYGPDGTALRSLGTVQDVTERVEAERGLHQSERRMRMAAEATGLGFFSYDFETGELSETPELLALYGVPEGGRLELDEDQVPSTVHPDDRAAFRTAAREALDPRGPGLLDLECRIVDAAGAVRWLHPRGKTSFTGREPTDRPTHIHGIVQDVTARKELDRRLAVEALKNKALLDASTDGILVLDCEGYLVLANDSFCRILGYSREELATRHVREWDPDWSLESVQRQLAKSFEMPQTFETRPQRRDGRRIDTEVNLVGAVIDEKGLIYASVRDITARKAQERELQRLANLYATLSRVNQCVLRGAPRDEMFREVCALTATHAGFKLVWIGQTAPGSLRVLPVACAGEHTAYLDNLQIYADERPEGQGPVGRCLRFGKPFVVNDFVTNPAMAPWRASILAHNFQAVAALPLRLGGRAVAAFTVYTAGEELFGEQEVALLEEIAATVSFALEHEHEEENRRRAEEQLRESAEKFHSFFANSIDAVLLTSPLGPIFEVNDSACKMFGWPREEFLLRGRDLMMDRDDPRLGAALEERARTGKFFGELTCRRADGSRFPGEVSTAIFLDGAGEQRATIIIRDITERKRAELALLEAKGAAEAASVAKSEFLANMSHEIRTPMNGIIGMTGLLLDTPLDEEQARYAAVVRTSGEALLGLINDILDFSKIEARKLDLETLDFDLTTLLDDFAATQALAAQAKGLEFFCAAHPEVPVRLQGDPGRLRQVLTNLVGNAVKFTAAGEVALHVSLVEEREDEVRLRFSVTDTGIGIPKNKLGLLFTQFTQADASTTRKFGGTGLGLAISKQLAALMGGEVGVESEVGRGSTFWFTARLAKQVGEVVPPLPPGHLEGVRVLVVDDSAANREILVTRLSSWGARVQEAQDGAAALRALYGAVIDRDPFLLAVIDEQMPGMDGVALGRVVRADDQFAALKLVMLTSLAVRGEARRFEELGFAGYATKPVRHDEFKAMLSLVLTQATGTGPAKAPIVTRHLAREKRNLFADRKGRLLVVEDNLVNQRVAQGILEKLGLRADVASSGAEALKAVEMLPYDLVLMDLQMPDMDGLEATRRIRNPVAPTRTKPAVPILAMTANAMRGDREKCLAAGMDDYVSKPVSLEALAEALAKWLPEESGTAAGRRTSRPARKPAPEFSEEQEAPIFAKASMLERLMGDEELAARIVKGFLADVPQRLEVLGGCWEAGDAKGVALQAHTIKGAAAYVGGERLEGVASEVEGAARSGNLAAAGAARAALAREFLRLKEAIENDGGNTLSPP